MTVPEHFSGRLPEGAMDLPDRLNAGAGAASIGLVGFAALMAPSFCQFGWTDYYLVGLVALAFSVLLPLVCRRVGPLATRLAYALNHAALVGSFWVAGLALGHVPAICR